MCTTSQSNEWDQLVAKIGLLTLTAGLLEAAVMTMHCKATNQSEAELKSRLNKAQRRGLKKAVKSLDWPDAKKCDLTKRLSEIAALDKRRNALIHLAAGFVSDNSIDGVPAGSAIDLRTYGFGVTKTKSGADGKVVSYSIGVVAKKIDMTEIDGLINDFQQARLGLVPYMDLVDAITHPARSADDLLNRLEKREPLS
jgi:hypothetical protein